jgi:hypothetical protein
MTETKKKQKTRVLLSATLTFISTELRSFETLLKIRPRGTLSKNSLRDEKRRLLIIDSWMRSLILGLELAIRRALI